MVLAYLRRLALRVAADSSAAILLACNIVALAFAFFNPPVSVSMLFLYWAECAVIGILNVAKLHYVLPTGYDEAALARLTPGERIWVESVGAGIFLVPYGLMLFGLFGMIYRLGEHEMQGKGVHHYDMAHHLAGFWFPVVLICGGHVASFFRDFLGKREYVGVSFEDQMLQPFKRAFIMCFVMFAAVAAIIVTGLPEFGLLFFIPFMIIASLEAHFRERGVDSLNKEKA
jgi:hypothetical protein